MPPLPIIHNSPNPVVESMARAEQIKHLKDFKRNAERDDSFAHLMGELKEKNSEMLLRKGELRLLHGDKEGIKYFELAAKYDPKNPQLFLQQGLALFEYGSSEGREEGLTLASKCFKMATHLDPLSFQAWHLWGNTLYFLGKRRQESNYFANALKKYEQAIKLSAEQPPDVLTDLYWDLGDLWSSLAEQSGDITDYHCAIKAYEKASTLQNDLSLEFWISFGTAYQTMAEKTNDTGLLVKAIHCYKNGVLNKRSFGEGWFFLGSSLKMLYDYTHDEDHFSQASECFATAIRLSKNYPKAYFEWACLLLESGIIFNDPKKIRAAIDTCAKAHRCDKKNSQIIPIWVEALALLGSQTEQLELIHEALGKIEPLIEKEKSPENYLAYGTCFYALGSYYKDIDYYYQALEQFQEGLSINRAHHSLWLAMASSSFAAALLDHDEKSYDRSLHFFEQTLHLKKSSLSHSRYAVCLLKYGEINHNREMIELAVHHFEQALTMQKNASYVHLDWMFYYASSLEQLGGFNESEYHYLKAIDLLNHILTVKPELPHLHFQLALTYSHYGILVNEAHLLRHAIHYYRIAYQKEKDNDQIILDWALTLVSLSDLLENDMESDQLLRGAEYKMIEAAKLGNTNAYYSLSCLYSLMGNLDNSLCFLEKAKQFDALPSVEEMLEDDWLENLRETNKFQSFVDQIEAKT